MNQIVTYRWMHMLRHDLPDLATFAAIAEAGSFTRAAGKLGASQSALSHAVRRLETRLGVRLLTRSTRSLALTDAGRKLLDTLRPALDQIEAQIAELGDMRDRPAGRIRITSADHAAETILWPALRRLLPDYPEVQIEVQIQNSLVDIVADGFDAGIRLGRNVDKDMIAVPIGPEERLVVVASPTYLATRKTPSVPQDLSGNDCINRNLPSLGGLSLWQFAKDGKQSRMRVEGRLAFNRPEMIQQAACDGFGFACLLESQVRSAVLRGRLVKVLEDWCPTFPGYHLYYASRRQPTSAFQVVVSALRWRSEGQAGL